MAAQRQLNPDTFSWESITTKSWLVFIPQDLIASDMPSKIILDAGIWHNNSDSDVKSHPLEHSVSSYVDEEPISPWALILVP